MGTTPHVHKMTVYCPIDGCNYTSRHWLKPNIHGLNKANKVSYFSLKCPKHQTVLTSKK